MAGLVTHRNSLSWEFAGWEVWCENLHVMLKLKKIRCCDRLWEHGSGWAGGRGVGGAAAAQGAAEDVCMGSGHTPIKLRSEHGSDDGSGALACVMCRIAIWKFAPRYHLNTHRRGFIDSPRSELA